MATFALDTSCMVAAVCTWHEHHEAATASIEQRLARGDRLAIAAPALVETYAVLTRLPPPHRLAPEDAWSLVKANFVDGAMVVALTGAAQARLLGQLATSSIGGGRTYDALIGACAAQADVDAILTFNTRHFQPAPKGVAVIEPTRTG